MGFNMIVRILYISLGGNTRHFIKKLQAYGQQLDTAIQIEAKEITDASFDEVETMPYFVLVPTYLDGGNGIDNGVKEIMTNPLHEQLSYQNNADHLIGVVGSGNKNFNVQYVLTARRYAEIFDAPLIGDYELRGNDQDVKRIFNALVARQTEYEATQQN